MKAHLQLLIVARVHAYSRPCALVWHWVVQQRWENQSLHLQQAPLLACRALARSLLLSHMRCRCLLSLRPLLANPGHTWSWTAIAYL